MDSEWASGMGSAEKQEKPCGVLLKLCLKPLVTYVKLAARQGPTPPCLQLSPEGRSVVPTGILCLEVVTDEPDFLDH